MSELAQITFTKESPFKMRDITTYRVNINAALEAISEILRVPRGQLGSLTISEDGKSLKIWEK